jgi:hypothetical protein
MTITVEPPPVEAPDAGVIEEARARQSRHRVAGAAAVAAAAIGAILLAFAGGGGGSHPGSARVHQGRPPPRTARLSPASCVSGNAKLLQRAPSRSLLSILGVLRRPAAPADVLPRRLALERNAFVRYVRRTRIVSGSPYYIYPAIVAGCGIHARQGIMHLETNIDLGRGLMGGTGGGGASAAQIEQGRSLSTGPPGSSTSSTITMIVPDGVAKVTLRFPAGRASGYSPKISPPFTITTAVVNNEFVVRVPRSGGGGAIHQATMIWRATNGHTLKTFNKL